MFKKRFSHSRMKSLVASALLAAVFVGLLTGCGATGSAAHSTSTAKDGYAIQFGPEEYQSALVQIPVLAEKSFAELELADGAREVLAVDDQCTTVVSSVDKNNASEFESKEVKESSAVTVESKGAEASDVNTGVVPEETSSEATQANPAPVGESATTIEHDDVTTYVDFAITQANRSKVGYTDETTHLVVPETFYDEDDGVWYRVVAIEDAPSISSGAFYRCTNLTSIELPASVTRIGNYAFRECTGLDSIEIPDSVTSIGKSAFWGCTNLTNVEIPPSVTSISNHAFTYCDSLTSIEIPDSVTILSGYVFAFCENLACITIPDSVTILDESAFQGCTSLTSIEIPDGVTYIGDWTFLGCSGLTSIEIPAGVTYIGVWAFENCTKLKSVTFENADGWYVSLDYTATSGENLTLVDDAANASLLKSVYCDYFWLRSEA